MPFSFVTEEFVKKKKEFWKNWAASNNDES